VIPCPRATRHPARLIGILRSPSASLPRETCIPTPQAPRPKQVLRTLPYGARRNGKVTPPCGCGLTKGRYRSCQSTLHSLHRLSSFGLEKIHGPIVADASLPDRLAQTEPQGMEALPVLPVAGACMLIPHRVSIRRSRSNRRSTIRPTLGLFQPTPSDVKERRRKMWRCKGKRVKEQKNKEFSPGARPTTLETRSSRSGSRG
jgi:hypothetical protein